MNRTTILITYRWSHGPSDTHIDVMVTGEGADVGDKTANKALTGAYKYALRQTLMIETGDDPDKYAEPQDTVAHPPARPAQAPARPAQAPALAPASPEVIAWANELYNAHNIVAANFPSVDRLVDWANNLAGGFDVKFAEGYVKALSIYCNGVVDGATKTDAYKAAKATYTATIGGNA